MTSPAIKPTEKNAAKAAAASSSTSSLSGGATTEVDASATMLPSTTQFNQCGLFSWLKVFRFADLLMRQGC